MSASRLLTSKTGIPSLAILDDYLSISASHFNHIPKSSLRIKPFTKPLPWQTEEDRALLVKQLKPFTAISTMRERTPFPGSVLRELPNLKLLLCTGTQFQTFDLATAKELGIAVLAAPGRGRTDVPPPRKQEREILPRGWPSSHASHLGYDSRSCSQRGRR
ncbi:hypothetical protein V2G26_017288 [Clonostachys chloroleuca]